MWSTARFQHAEVELWEAYVICQCGLACVIIFWCVEYAMFVYACVFVWVCVCVCVFVCVCVLYAYAFGFGGKRAFCEHLLMCRNVQRKLWYFCLMLWELCVSVCVHVSVCVICWLWSCQFCQLHTCRNGSWGLVPTSVCVIVCMCIWLLGQEGFLWALVDVEKCAEKNVILLSNVMGAMCKCLCVCVCMCHMLVVKL